MLPGASCLLYDVAATLGGGGLCVKLKGIQGRHMLFCRKAPDQPHVQEASHDTMYSCAGIPVGQASIGLLIFIGFFLVAAIFTGE
jgi:hypothetical protein